MADLLIDTDVLIDHLAGRTRISGRRSRLGFSVISRAELGAGARDETELAPIRRLLGAMTEYPIDKLVAEQAGRIRADTGVRLPDALIAATALVHGLTLDTRNLRDFKRVPNLRLRGSSRRG